MKAYRVENQAAGHGIWRNFDGSLNPVFAKLSDGLAKNLPMPDSDFYREGGKQWFSATDTPEKLTAWFSLQDVLEMLAMGYEVWEFEITDCRTVSEYEIVFTRDSIVSQRAIDYRDIWGGSNRIKPCPFCGKMPILKTDTRYPRPECEPRKAYEVVCQNVDCIIGFVDERYRLSAQEAVEAWNRRANDEDA